MGVQPPPLQQQIDRLRSAYEEVRRSAAMDDVTHKLSSVTSEITSLPDQIAGLRSQGYVFASYLERKAEVLASQWEQISDLVRQTVVREIARVQEQLDILADLWGKVEQQTMDRNRAILLTQIERAISSLSEEIKAAQKRIEAMYGDVPGNVSQTQQQIRQIQQYLKLAQEAHVSWKPAERLFSAIEAKWLKGNKDTPEGILYLTDQRLIFEQKEKVGGRFGFGGEMVQQELWAVPVGAVSEIRPEDKGVFGGKDLVHLTLRSGDYAELSLEIKGGIDSKAYAHQLNRVLSGDIENERAVPVDEAQAEAIRQAPTICPTCGATLPALLRGMTELTCTYCGTTVRI